MIEYFCKICGGHTIKVHHFGTMKHYTEEERENYRACYLHMIPMTLDKFTIKSDKLGSEVE